MSIADRYATIDLLLSLLAAGGDLDGTLVADQLERGGPTDIDLAAAALHDLAAGRRKEALERLSGLLRSPLGPSPLETALESLGARLATMEGDEELALSFLERRAAYLARYGSGRAFARAAELAATPESWLDELADMLGPDERLVSFGSRGEPSARWDVPDEAASPLGSLTPITSQLVPLASDRDPPQMDTASAGSTGSGVADAKVYLVTLRHLEDARTAEFSVHHVGWHELETDQQELSDLVLTFDASAESLLRRVDPEALSLRLFFGEGPAFDEVSTGNGTLFDVEVNPAELRIYLKLRRPAAWAGTGLAIAELWRQLRTCVLITEPS